MFIIQVGSEKHLWNNGIGDDFIRFLPEYFSCNPSEIQSFFIQKSDELALTAHLKAGSDHIHAIGDNGSIDLKVVVPGVVTPPTLNVGDDDPNAPGQKVQSGDPRTQEQVAPPTASVVKTIQGHKLAGWPYEDDPESKGGLKFTGNVLA